MERSQSPTSATLHAAMGLRKETAAAELGGREEALEEAAAEETAEEAEAAEQEPEPEHKRDK
jgi:hypothetical protein